MLRNPVQQEVTSSENIDCLSLKKVHSALGRSYQVGCERDPVRVRSILSVSEGAEAALSDIRTSGPSYGSRAEKYIAHRCLGTQNLSISLTYATWRT
jgi:hypothetical protein